MSTFINTINYKLNKDRYPYEVRVALKENFCDIDIELQLVEDLGDGEHYRTSDRYTIDFMNNKIYSITTNRNFEIVKYVESDLTDAEREYIYNMVSSRSYYKAWFDWII